MWLSANKWNKYTSRFAVLLMWPLGSSTSCVAALKPAERTQPSREHGFKALFQANRYTAFDIWCAKASQETFRPIKEDIIFNKLLLRSGIFPEVYDTKNLEANQIATRMMNPATSVNSAHWKQFVEETEPWGRAHVVRNPNGEALLGLIALV